MEVGSSSSSSTTGSLQQTIISSFEDSSPIRKHCKENRELTEDVWFDIFLHLPLEPIFKFRAVSKVWLFLLSNPNFVIKWIRLNSLNLSSPWALVYSINSPRDDHAELFSVASLNVHSQLISGHDGFSFKFLPLKPENLNLCGSSNGLVLCSTSSYNRATYYVCNPLTKKWVSLPPPPLPPQNTYGYLNHPRWVVIGFFCESTSPDYSTTYKVVRIPEFVKNLSKFYVEIFSSDLGVWKSYPVSCPQEVTWQLPLYSNVVTHNGVLYWFEGRNSILAYHFNNNNNNETGGHQCRLIDLPDEERLAGNSYIRCDSNHGRCLGQSEGVICYAQIERMQRTLSVWVLDEGWHLLHENIELNNILEEMDSRLLIKKRGVNSAKLIQAVAFHPLDRNVMILGCHNQIFAYNVRTRRYEELRCPSYLCNSDPDSIDHKVLPFVLTPRPTILPPLSVTLFQVFI